MKYRSCQQGLDLEVSGWYGGLMGDWTFLTNHTRVLACVAQQPGVRLREIAACAGITERAAHRIV